MMDEVTVNRWSGKSAEDVLAESFHELRDPILVIAGYLNVLKSTEVASEQTQYLLDSALRSAIRAKEIVESVYQYMNEQRKDQ
jgi:signal transduction histidine kinase